MNSKLKKASIALAGIMSAVAIASVVPAGTGATFGSVATVAHAANNWSYDINSDTVFSGDTVIPKSEYPFVGNGKQCVIIIDGNLILDSGYYEWEDFGDGEMYDSGEYGGAVRVSSGSSVIVTGNLICGVKSSVNVKSGKLIVGGTITNNGGDIAGVSASSLPGLGYVAENADHYAYFTSNGQGYYTYNGSDFVATTYDALKKATATYAQVGDYTGKDDVASAWSVTVTPGRDTITSLDVKVNDRGSEEGAWTDIPEITGGNVVFAVAVNKAAKDVSSVTAVVNGSNVKTTSVE